MKLCLITNDPDPKTVRLLTEQSGGENEMEIILLQEAVRRTDVRGGRVYVGGEDLKERGTGSPYPTLDYKQMVERIFSSDRVLCL
jgi:hypothetical protein